MNDYDGSGFALKIPAYMLDHGAFLKIKSALKDGKEVYLKAEQIISRPDNSIEMGIFWGSSLDVTEYTMEALNELVQQHSTSNTTDSLLSLHVHTFACPTCPKEIKEEDCVSNGAYCAFFPKHGDISQEDLDPEDYVVQEAMFSSKISIDFTGRELLISSLFEKCAHMLIANQAGPGMYSESDFLEMMLYRNAECNKQLELTGSYKKYCLAQNFEDPVLEPFVEKIAKCVGDSFEDPEDYESNNSLLALDKAWGTKHNLIAHPSILINDFTYRGDIDYRDLKQAICSAYKVRPDHCNIAAALEDAENINVYANATFLQRFLMVF